MKNDTVVTVVGAGLAGAEAAYQLAKRNIPVELVEMRPKTSSPAHHTDRFAELVCSNSLRSDRIENAVGLLKAEMRELDSLILRCADQTRVPAGGALAVDRDGFSKMVTDEILNNPMITVRHEEQLTIPETPTILATGPLTSEAMCQKIEALTGHNLHFYDAAAPIVSYDSLDHTKVFRASRYERGDDYLNCPMTRDEYVAFWQALVTAETVPLKEFEKNPRVFEGCMPVEVMAKRGEKTLCFGPLKPVGLEINGKRPFAVVQLRQDDASGALWNIVGFQTNLKFGEQKRVFSMIPGLENAEFVRYGVMHRNTFLPGPEVLNSDYSFRGKDALYFAGQITGVEGYVESASSGFVAGVAMARRLLGLSPVDFPRTTAIGALAHYVSGAVTSDFQPMNVTFGIMDGIENPPRNKVERYHLMAERALGIVKELKTSL